jgi:diguanylate cyclase (GGDEF)-like protein
VTVVGLIAATILFAVADWSALTSDPVLVATLTGLVVAGELFPVTVTFRNERQQITTSTPFVLAMLLMFGPGPAVAAQLLASVVADVVRRKEWWKAAFNVGQYSLSWIAASLVLYAVLGPYRYVSVSAFSTPRILVVALGALTFFLCNMTLVAVAVALAQDLPIGPHLRRGLGFYGLSSLTLFSLAPVIVIVASQQPTLIPLLLAPILAVYRTAQVTTEKEHQALYDPLTDLANRLLLKERIAQSIAERPGSPFAVMLIDLDHFKEINDTLGHQIGDELLTMIGRRLADTAAPAQTVARLGGDEFAVVIAIEGGSDQARRHNAGTAAVVVAGSFDKPFRIDELTFEIEASIGAALYPEHGRAVDELLRHADVAMYQAKDLGTGIEVYRPAQDQHDSRRLALLGELRHAIDAGDIVCYFQPKADLRTGRVVGAEALVRWEHPERGHLTPDQFIPLAEPTGLISSLTICVLDSALRQQREWAARSLELSVSVNVSVRTLYDEWFPYEVRRLLEHHRVPPGMLVLEVTESTMMSDPARAAAVLARLAELGVQLSVDDFGTGYSSLAYLKRLPMSEVKIDKSFVLNMENDCEQRAIVTSIVDLGRNLGLRVVAEGVETAPAWSLLRKLGCNDAQGYLLSRPLPPDQFPVWVRDHEERRRGSASPHPPGGVEIDLRAADAPEMQMLLDGIT